MKKILTSLLVLFFLQSFSQKFFSTNEKFGEFIDFTNKSIKIKVNNDLFEGPYEYIYINSARHFIIGNANKILVFYIGASLPSSYTNDVFIEEIYVLNQNSIKSIYEIVDKKKTLFDKKINIEYDGKKDPNQFFTSKEHYKPYWGSKFISEKKLEIEKKKLEDEVKKNTDKIAKTLNYDKISNLNEYVGTYEISLYTFEGVELMSDKKFAKLYITEAGITLKTELDISENTLRGSHNKDSFFTPSKEGEFYCKASHSFWEDFICLINLKTNSGSISTTKGKTIKTSTFKILKKNE